jgi:F-type H+-transporting ATPase subunit gamma
MTERLEDIRRHRAVIDEIGEVVSALRAIAAAHSAEAQTALDAISVYEGHVASALTRLAVPVPPTETEGSGLTVVVGAAQGFCGGYPARVAEAAHTLVRRGSGLLVIGQRTNAMLSQAGITPVWSADLPAAPRFVPALASQVSDALLDLGERFPGPISALSGADAPGLPIESRAIWPPEPYDPEGTDRATMPPLTTLPTAELLRGLLAETLFAEVARTIMQGLRLENRARVEAMARAQSNLKTRRAEVDQRYRQARQEQMTTEVIELSLGEQAT